MIGTGRFPKFRWYCVPLYLYPGGIEGGTRFGLRRRYHKQAHRYGKRVSSIVVTLCVTWCVHEVARTVSLRIFDLAELYNCFRDECGTYNVPMF